jgi:prophage tail gpP-like protein
VSGWTAPNGELWRDNTLVTVQSDTIFCPDGFTFLIRSVEFEVTDKGYATNLNLVPPQVFSGEEIEEPWL